MRKNLSKTIGRLVLLLVLFSASSKLYSQTYDRKSLTVLIARYTDGQPISTYYFKGGVSERYDYNNIGTKEISLNTNFGSAEDFHEDQLIEKIYADRIPNKILKSILIDESKSYMTVDVVQERGLYNASDAEYTLAKNSARGIDILKDAGVKLLGNIYFLVIQPTAYSVTYNKGTTGNDHQLQGRGYLYQLDLDSAYMAKKFWEDFYFDSPNQTMYNKLMNHRFPLKRTSIYFNVSVSDLDGINTVSSLLNSLNKQNQSEIQRKSTDQIYRQLFERAQSDCLASIQSDADFLLKSAVFKTRPLKAKIGRKESLRTDKLFEVTEKVINQKTGGVETRHIGWVRAKWVADNTYRTNGASKASSFYRISSKRIRKGMELVDAWDSDLTLGVSYSPDSLSLFGGYFANIEYLTHWLPGLSVAFEAGYNPNLKSESVDYIDERVSGYLTGEGLTGSLIIRQSFSFHRISLTPLGGILASYVFVHDGNVRAADGSVINAAYIDKEYRYVEGGLFGLVWGGDVGLNLGRTLQLRAGYRFDESMQPAFRSGSSFPYYTNYSKKTLTFGLRFARL